jgi:hypothetical protein
MPVEAERLRMTLVAPSRDEIGDSAPIRPEALETGFSKKRFQKRNRASFLGRDGGTAHQMGGQVYWITTHAFG